MTRIGSQEESSREIGAHRVGLAGIRIGEACPLKMRAAEVRPGESHLDQAGFGEVRRIGNRVWEDGPSQDRLSDMRKRQGSDFCVELLPAEDTATRKGNRFGVVGDGMLRLYGRYGGEKGKRGDLSRQGRLTSAAHRHRGGGPRMSVRGPEHGMRFMAPLT